MVRIVQKTYEDIPIIINPKYTNYLKKRIYSPRHSGAHDFSYSHIISEDISNFFHGIKGNSPLLNFEIQNRGCTSLENCLFKVSMDQTSERNFHPYFPTWDTKFDISNYELITKFEFSLNKQAKQFFSHEIEFAEYPPQEEVFTLFWEFTSKQNLKPYTGVIHCKVVPEINKGKPDVKFVAVEADEYEEEVIEPLPTQ